MADRKGLDVIMYTAKALKGVPRLHSLIYTLPTAGARGNELPYVFFF